MSARTPVHQAREKHPMHPDYILVRARVAAMQPVTLKGLREALAARMSRQAVTHAVDVLTKMGHIEQSSANLRLASAGTALVDVGNRLLTADPPVLPDPPSPGVQFFCGRLRRVLAVSQCAGNWQHRCSGEPCSRGGVEGCLTGATAFRAGRDYEAASRRQRNEGAHRRLRARSAA